MMEEQVKIIVFDGRLFVEFEDGSRLPIMADKNGNVYVEDE